MIESECADNYVVKYWQRLSPHLYELTDLTLEDSIAVDVTPRVVYQAQAVAREDKGGQLVSVSIA